MRRLTPPRARSSKTSKKKPATNQQTKSKTTDPRVQPCVHAFLAGYRQAIGDDYPASVAAVGKAIKGLPASYDAAAVVAILPAYFATETSTTRRGRGRTS